jgi:hypothetical protein
MHTQDDPSFLCLILCRVETALYNILMVGLYTHMLTISYDLFPTSPSIRQCSVVPMPHRHSSLIDLSIPPFWVEFMQRVAPHVGFAGAG